MMNPIFVSSARKRMRSIRVAVIFTLYAAALLVMAWLSTLSVFSGDVLRLRSMRNGIDGYIEIAAIQFALIVFIAPAMTAGAISGERERQTMDLLLVTNTNCLRIAFGKLMESFAYMALLIVCSAPILCVSLLMGGISIIQILETIAFLLISAMAALSVGLFASAIFKRTITATVAAYLLIFAIGIGTGLPLLRMSDKFGNYTRDMALLQTLTPDQVLPMIPKIVFVNPALGLICLLSDQTQLLKSVFTRLLGRSQAYEIFSQLSFSMIARVNALIMAGLGLVLTFISAALIRPRTLSLHKRPRRG